MKALVFHKPKDVRVERVDDPAIEHPRDAIVRVTSTAICGSDLHIYNGAIPQLEPMILGHEFMGVVQETGAEVSNLARGDRIVVPFPIACGRCWFCDHDLPTHCSESNAKYGPEGGLTRDKGAGLFGYTDLYGGYDGGQAEYVRVPYADFGPRKIPDDLADDEVLFLSDILPTGWCAVRWAEVKPEETVAVFGCGPVGLMAQKMARVLGAKQVIGIDRVPERLDMARRTAGSETIDFSSDDPVEAIREMTEGRGADVCIDAVGMEVERGVLKRISNVLHAQRGSITALRLCFSAVRRGGRVSVVGVYATHYDNFPLGQQMDKAIRVNIGQAPVQAHIDELFDLVKDGRIKADDIITHRMSLEDAPRGYHLFNNKEDGCVKVVLHP